MLGLDNITLLFLTGAAHALLATMLFSVRKPFNTDVMRLFATSQLIFAFGLLLIFGRRFGESFWFISFPNSLLTLAFTLLAIAVARFLDWPHHRHIVWFAIPLVAVQLVLRELGLLEHWRLTFAVVLSASPQAFLSYLLVKHWRSASALMRFVVVSNVILSALFLLRAIESATADSDYNFFHAGIGQELGLLAVYANVFINGFGFLLAINEQTNREMRRLSTLDPMTKLLNRQSFLASAMKTLTAADRESRSVSIVFCSLRQLHKINIDAGEYTGDETIRRTVAAIKLSLHEHDIAGRWQGHQFTVLLAGKTVEEALVWSQHVLTDFATLAKQSKSAVNTPLHIVVTRYRSHEDFLLALQRVQTSLDDIPYEADSQVLLCTV